MTTRQPRPVATYEPADDDAQEADRLNAALQQAISYMTTEDRKGNRRLDGRVNWHELRDPRPIKCRTGANGTTARPPWRLLKDFAPTSRHQTALLTDAAALAAGFEKYGPKAHRSPRHKPTAMGTALLLNDTAALDALGESELSALDIWAAKLLGFARGQQDANGRHDLTRHLIHNYSLE